MDTSPSITLSALKFFSGENNHVCRLCFGSTERQEFTIEDSFSAKSNFIDATLTIREMFLELGVPTEPSLPQAICESCTTVTINSYLFRKLCQYSNEKWNETVDILEQSLSETNMLSPAVQTAFIVVKKDKIIIFPSRKSNKTKSKSAALSEMKCVMDNKNKYMNKIKKIICEECGLQRTSLKALMRHMETHASSKKIETVTDKPRPNNERKQILCPQCPSLFSKESQLTSHVESEHTGNEFQCSKCPRMFSSLKMLKGHENNYHVAVDCRLCSKRLPSKIAYHRHKDIKHFIDKCPKCDKSFSNRATYRTHVKICGDPNSKICNFFCDLCGKGYTRKIGLKSHLRMKHGFGEQVTCNWCFKQFDAISKLKYHMIKHTRERNFQCEQCGGKFVNKAALRYHTRLHTGEKPYPCDLCEESFVSASRRMEHKYRKHFEPTKECSVCHIKFATNSQLKKHFRRHSNPQSNLYIPTENDQVSTIHNTESRKKRKQKKITKYSQ